MKIPKGSPIFDQLPSQFSSFFPSEQSLVDGKLQAVITSAGGKQGDLLVRLQAETITQGLQLVAREKAVMVGDFLSSAMPALVSFKEDSWGQKVPQGLFASVPFPATTFEDPMLGAMVEVGLNLALNAVSAVPIVGRLIGLFLNIGMALAKLLKSSEGDPEVPRLLVPWTRYSRDRDEDLVNKGLIQSTAGTVSWTNVWLPGLGGEWQFNRVTEDGSKEKAGARVYAPMVGKSVGWGTVAGLGAIPNTLRVAGPVQTIVDDRLRSLAWAGDAEAKRDWALETRYILRGDSRKTAEGTGVYNELFRPPTIIDTGAYYPGFAGIAGQLWQQVQQRGNPDMFKVEAPKIRDAWQTYWGGFFSDAFSLVKALENAKSTPDDQLRWLWAALTPYVVVIQQNGKSVTLGMRNISRPHPGPLVVPGMFSGQGPGPLWLRTKALYSEVKTKAGWDQIEGPGDMAILGWDGRILEPSRTEGFKSGYEMRAVPWPSGEELFSYYKRPDDGIITPACDALAQSQLWCLSGTLVCAYVRPVALPDGSPAHAAFSDAALRKKCLEMREVLLKHDARFGISLADAETADKPFADKLRASGVGKIGAAKLASRPSALVPGPPPKAYPVPAGGLSFDVPRPKRRARPDYTKAAVAAGALAAAGIAIAAWRRYEFSED